MWIVDADITVSEHDDDGVWLVVGRFGESDALHERCELHGRDR
jgi:hypothetical protein